MCLHHSNLILIDSLAFLFQLYLLKVRSVRMLNTIVCSGPRQNLGPNCRAYHQHSFRDHWNHHQIHVVNTLDDFLEHLPYTGNDFLNNIRYDIVPDTSSLVVVSHTIH
jgi:hypothetical protein